MTEVITKRSKRLSQVFQGQTASITALDIKHMPDGHASCGRCENPWLQFQGEGRKLRSGCSKCGLEGVVDLTGLNIDELCPDFLHQSGDVTCPSCGSTFFLLQKNGNKCCIGCKKCAFQWVFDLEKIGMLYV